jgi:hypothetical protein
MTDTGRQPKGRIRAMRLLIDKGATRYDCNQHLDRLLGGYSDIWSAAASEPAATIARLKRALRSQRQLGRAGHWSYDLNRHFGLLQALKAELSRSRDGEEGRGARKLAQPTAAAGENAVRSASRGTSETGTETS